MSTPVTLEQVTLLFQQFEQKLEQKLDKKFDNIDKKFDNIDKKFDNIDKKFVDIDKTLTTVGDKVKKQGKSITKIFLDLEDIKKKVGKMEKKMDVLYDERRENSINAEKHLNESVVRYLQKKYVDANIIDVKAIVAEKSLHLYSSINKIATRKYRQKTVFNITDKKSLLLYPPISELNSTINPITELDGLYGVQYNRTVRQDGQSRVKEIYELFIVEAKLEFTVEHLQDKITSFSKIKKLITTSPHQFTFPEYGDFISKYFKPAHKISMIFGTLDWKFPLGDYVIMNNEISNSYDYSFSHGVDLFSNESESDSIELNYHKLLEQIPQYPENTVNQLYNDNIVYPLTERPDLLFFVYSVDGFVDCNDVPSLSGGDDLASSEGDVPSR